ncbi:hypothetical protein BGZ63DRAFT_391021 [Mariannaea sp. PMI_226]|nr:hypothetical protein BGZ63DRAFT_391021 [Mariannaea sp. PMI_226]
MLGPRYLILTFCVQRASSSMSCSSSKHSSYPPTTSANLKLAVQMTYKTSPRLPTSPPFNLAHENFLGWFRDKVATLGTTLVQTDSVARTGTLVSMEVVAKGIQSFVGRVGVSTQIHNNVVSLASSASRAKIVNQMDAAHQVKNSVEAATATTQTP